MFVKATDIDMTKAVRVSTGSQVHNCMAPGLNQQQQNKKCYRISSLINHTEQQNEVLSAVYATDW